MKRICSECEQEAVKHFFINDICIPCASKLGVTAEAKKSDDYEIIEDKGCAGGACTL